MERHMERRPEAEPVSFSRHVEGMQGLGKKQQNLLATLPRVVKFDEVPWVQNAQAFQKSYTGPDIKGRLTQHPVCSFTLREQTIFPGATSGKHRHYPEAIFYVVEGEGYEIHDDVKYPWEAGDIMCVPTYCVHQHFNPTSDQHARLFFSVPLAFELMGIFQIEQVEMHANYQVPEGAELIRGLHGELVGYKASDGLEFRLGFDLEYQHMMEAKRALTQFTSQPQTIYDQYLKTLAEQTRWRQGIPHVVHAKDVHWENSRMGKIKYLLSPYRPSPLVLYDAFIQEIPPGGHSGKHRHVSEEAHKILQGRGYDVHDGVRHDWGPEDIVVIPVNTVHQHFNADPNRTAVFVAFQSRMYHYLGHGGYEHLEDASQ